MNKQEFIELSFSKGLKVVRQSDSKIVDYSLAYYISEFGQSAWSGKCKPILHSLSDTTKEIEHKGEKFVPIEKILEENCFDLSKMDIEEINSYAAPVLMPELISLSDALLLIEWHFDIAGLIEKGEAIDVNTLETNPYK